MAFVFLFLLGTELWDLDSGLKPLDIGAFECAREQIVSQIKIETKYRRGKERQIRKSVNTAMRG